MSTPLQLINSNKKDLVESLKLVIEGPVHKRLASIQYRVVSVNATPCTQHSVVTALSKCNALLSLLA